MILPLVNLEKNTPLFPYLTGHLQNNTSLYFSIVLPSKVVNGFKERPKNQNYTNHTQTRHAHIIHAALHY